jgi:SynChlorMet cassette protein ScmC
LFMLGFLAEQSVAGLPSGAAVHQMPASFSQAPHGLKLGLADGQQWLIRPVDGAAEAIVAELGNVMQLSPGESGRELCVAVCGESGRSDLEPGGAVVCRLAAPADRETEVAQMRRIASQIAREAMGRGGLLFHGALAEYRGSGFIMAGPGTVGKSTASRRLPPPWRSLCDDMTLVVRDGRGRFWAHPWPTWSRFLYGGPGGSWPVEHAVPVRAVFFLLQSPADELEPVNATQAAALTMESAEELMREVLLELTDADSARMLCSEALSVAKGLAAAVPAYSLKVSLDGRFWEEVERVLPVGDVPQSDADGPGLDPTSVDSLTSGDSLRVVCTGVSMIPTLDEPDLLEVQPYGAARVRPGDVVCFKVPETGKTVVHRVVSVGPHGIRTRGDNNPADDNGVLQAGDITGRIIAAQRGARRRVVRGGWRGIVLLGWARLGRRTRRGADRLTRALYDFVAGFGPFDRLLPANLRPRPVHFHTRYRSFLKLLMGRQAVGHYDFRRQTWHIRQRFRLFVDERALRRAAVSVNSGEETRD